MNAPSPNDAWRRPIPPPNGDSPGSEPVPAGSEPALIYFGDTHVGRRRTINQDNFVVGDVQLPAGHAVLLAVADGMGGAAGGEVASSHAIEELQRVLQDVQPGRSEGDLLAEGIIAANRAIFEHGRTDPSLQGMGTTMVMVLVRGRQAVVGHVGDSRALLIRGGMVHRLTIDHSWVAEQVRRGEITEEEAEQSNFRNVLTRSVGVAAGVTPEVSPPFELFPGDVLLLCSDGLHGYVPEPVIAQVATTEEPQAAVAHLINLANEAGGPDNITVVIGRVPGAPPAAVLPPPTPTSTVAPTERIPASAVPPVPQAGGPAMPPSSPGTPRQPGPPAAQAAIPPQGVPVPAGPLLAPPKAPPEKGRNRPLLIGGAIAAALAIIGGGLFAATRGSKSNNPGGGQISPTNVPSASATAQLTVTPTSGGQAGGNPATPPPAVNRTATPTATQGAEIAQTAPSGGSPAPRPLFLIQPIATLPRCEAVVSISGERSLEIGPCQFRVPAEDNIDWNAEVIRANFGITPDCLRRANQEYHPGEPRIGLIPSATSPNDLNIMEGTAYRLVTPEQCAQLLPVFDAPRPPTATPGAFATARPGLIPTIAVTVPPINPR